MLGPSRAVLGAEVAGQGLLAPGAGAQVGDRGEGADGFVEGGVFEELFLDERRGRVSFFSLFLLLF